MAWPGEEGAVGIEPMGLVPAIRLNTWKHDFPLDQGFGDLRITTPEPSMGGQLCQLIKCLR
jgi:hypothetical protein